MQMSHNSFQMWDMELSKKLVILREKRGVSDREIARSLKASSPEMKVSATTVGRWMLGVSVPDLEQAVALAEYFGVPLTYLAYDDTVTTGDLPEDEATVLRFYRSKKAKGEIDEDDAIMGIASMAKARDARQPIVGHAAEQTTRKKGTG
jgi:transcriptional regulator with XRE-family HTH domain